MIQIFLDGKPAIPTANAEIKLTKENPLFTKSASYTYDVVLPLDIAENRAIFGLFNRMDVEKSPMTVEALLVVDNKPVLAGTAHVTSVDEKDLKIQLLGEEASYNYGNKMDDLYIDKLELGDWYRTTWPDGSFWNGRLGAWNYIPEDFKFTGHSGGVFSRAQYDDDGKWSTETLLHNLFSGEYPWVAFPVNNSSADFGCNNYCYRVNAGRFSLFLRSYQGEYLGKRPSENPPVASGAIQPYVWLMAEKIAKATGFDLAREDNALYSNPFFRRIFIVNTNNFMECNKCLPHWSVNEWWSQIENTFGVVMAVDYADKRMSLRMRKDHYSTVAEVIELHDVVDQYKVDVDDTTQSDLSVNNVGFSDFDNTPEDLLSEFILQNSETNTDFADLAELHAWAVAEGEKAMATRKHVLYQCADGRQYIYSEAEGLVEVNMFRPRITDPERDEIETELKFVPAHYIDKECLIYPPTSAGGASGTPHDSSVGSFAVRMLEAPGISEMDWYKGKAEENIDIEAILDESESESKVTDDIPDLIYLAIANLDYETVNATVTLENGSTYTHDFLWPRPFLRCRSKAALDGTPGTDDAPQSLSLIPIPDEENLASHTLSPGSRINTKAKYCISFVMSHIPPSDAIFLIHNKRFVCEKIEANIATTGLRPLLTGYFYELTV